MLAIYAYSFSHEGLNPWNHDQLNNVKLNLSLLMLLCIYTEEIEIRGIRSQEPNVNGKITQMN